MTQTHTHVIEQFGFQAGPEGFINLGTGPPGDLSRWEEALYIAAFGGRGGGKSEGGVMRDIKYACAWPGASGLLVAPTMRRMWDATFPVMQRVLRKMGLKQGYHYEVYQRPRDELILKEWDVTIYLRSFDDPEALRGQDIAFFHLDEGRTAPLEVWTNLVATNRQQGYPHQGWVSTTPPEDMEHWLYWVFFAAEAQAAGFFPEELANSLADEELEGRYVAFNAPTRDNPHGGEAQYRRLVRLFGKDSPIAKRELEGVFARPEEMVYPAFSRERHAIPREKWPAKLRDMRISAGLDFGWTNPSAIEVGGIDQKGRRYRLDEFYRSHVSLPQLAQEAGRLMKLYDIEAFWADRSSPATINFLRGEPYRLPVIASDAKRGSPIDFSSGIGLCTYALSQQAPDGSSMFYVDPVRCPNWIREIENYRNPLQTSTEKPLTEKPVNIRDHAMDAWRYDERGIVKWGWDRTAAHLSSGLTIHRPR